MSAERSSVRSRLRRPADRALASHGRRSRAVLPSAERPLHRLLDVLGVARFERVGHCGGSSDRSRARQGARREQPRAAVSAQPVMGGEFRTAEYPGTPACRHGHACGRARRSGAASGNTLPGLSRPLASKAHFSRCCWLRSISENIAGIRSRFSTPTPCSPVSTPPTSTQSLQDVGAERLRPLELARLVGIVQDQRMQIAVAGVEHVGDAQPVLLRQLAHAREHLRQLARAGWCRPCSSSRARCGRPPGTPPCGRPRTAAAPPRSWKPGRSRRGRPWRSPRRARSGDRPRPADRRASTISSASTSSG